MSVFTVCQDFSELCELDHVHVWETPHDNIFSYKIIYLDQFIENFELQDFAETMATDWVTIKN